MEEIIEIVITILFVALPLLFKGIGKKLEKAGNTDKAGEFKKIADSFSDEEGEEETLEGWLLKKMETGEDAAAEPVPLNPEPVFPPKPTVSRKPMMLVEDEPKREKEKIDPRKLVLYSEIMKQKF